MGYIWVQSDFHRGTAEKAAGRVSASGGRHRGTSLLTRRCLPCHVNRLHTLAGGSSHKKIIGNCDRPWLVHPLFSEKQHLQTRDTVVQATASPNILTNSAREGHLQDILDTLGAQGPTTELRLGQVRASRHLGV